MLKALVIVDDAIHAGGRKLDRSCEFRLARVAEPRTRSDPFLVTSCGAVYPIFPTALHPAIART